MSDMTTPLRPPPACALGFEGEAARRHASAAQIELYRAAEEGRAERPAGIRIHSPPLLLSGCEVRERRREKEGEGFKGMRKPADCPRLAAPPSLRHMHGSTWCVLALAGVEVQGRESGKVCRSRVEDWEGEGGGDEGASKEGGRKRGI